MAYLANQTRVSSLTINGTDYTNALVEWQVSDQTAYKNGCLATTGSLRLGQVPGGFSVADYERDDFKRGAVVILDVVEPGGAAYRHPRGYLYVISVAYDVESENLVVELGCRLALMALTDDVDHLITLSPIFLDTAQKTYQNISAAFASVGKYIYQDNQGALQTGVFFDGDTTSGVAAGEWTSVLGVTALSVKPLQGSGAIPDEIDLSYQVPLDGLAGDNTGHEETTTEVSNYFLQYPAVTYIRVNSDADASNPNGTLGNVGGVSYAPSPTTGTASDCGNTPSKPGGNGDTSCNQGYELKSQPTFVAATRTTETKTTYGAPAAQVSKIRQEVRGPAVEANSQYFADKYAYCRGTWATACQPNGACEMEGLNEILLSYTETTNYYGTANELVRAVVDTYNTTLSAAQPADWRSGVLEGIPQQFNGSLSQTDMYRVSRVDTRYSQLSNGNVQLATTWQSVASRGVGISEVNRLDALNGIKTTVKRTSTTTATLDIAPDRLNTATTSTIEKTTKLPLFTKRYQVPPAESGPYAIEEQIPMPLLFTTQAEIDSAVNAYANYITRFVKGDAFGLQIAESMRAEIVTNWRPGKPFRYSDQARNKILAFRMDACSWGVSQTESVVVTNGIWIGESNGTLVPPENIVGDSKPDMGSGPGGVTTVVPPSVDNETNVDSGTFAWIVDVNMMFQVKANVFGRDGVTTPAPAKTYIEPRWSFTCWVSGLTVQTGGLLSTNPDGSVPLNLGGSLVTTGATIVDADLFTTGIQT